MIQVGDPGLLGACSDKRGVNFAIWSGAAEAVELCLYNESRQETARHFLPEQSDGVWHGYLPGARPGQRYGYRIHGAWSPEEGLRFNPAKLLIDPYARRLDGVFNWAPAVHDFLPESEGKKWRRNEQDSAPYLPLCVVDAPDTGKEPNRPWIPWAETVIYEASVRGFTMRHPDIPEAERGKFRGLNNGQVLDYLKALGITSVELMPVHSYLDEAFLVKKGLRNLWGYNSIQFFTPDIRFASYDPVSEFREMVNAIHEAGMEVILDVAYNHTGEADRSGPTLSFRGIDNRAYYRLEEKNPARYVNDSGCGNTLNADHPRVQDLVLDSLVYWHREMGVDGFRFDLATVLGRSRAGFTRKHPLLIRMGIEPELWRAKLIAEPWDPGPGGYQLGAFPIEWAEWNDRYRDSVRRFWRGDTGQSSEFARRIHGSADLFEPGGRDPNASINFITSHDGFTLWDLVTFEERNNEANGEANRDGHSHNYSSNYGEEGETGDESINSVRRRQRLNLMATLLFSQGTPMLLAGDEFGNSQEGNNNAYAQDNETGWLDWSRREADPGFTSKVRELLQLRRYLPLLRLPRYVHGRMPTNRGWCDITWWHPEGRKMRDDDWNGGHQLALLFSVHEKQKKKSPVVEGIAILYNASSEKAAFTLPPGTTPGWELQFFSSDAPPHRLAELQWELDARSLVLMTTGC